MQLNISFAILPHKNWICLYTEIHAIFISRLYHAWNLKNPYLVQGMGTNCIFCRTDEGSLSCSKTDDGRMERNGMEDERL